MHLDPEAFRRAADAAMIIDIVIQEVIELASGPSSRRAFRN